MSGCCTVGLAFCELFCAGILLRQPGMLQKKAERSSTSVGFIVFLPSMEHCPGRFSQLRPLSVCVCVCCLSLVSCIPNIFIDIFVCCSHLGPPWVSINLRCQPRPHVSWPFFGLSRLPRRLYNTLVTSHISSCLLCNNKHSIRGCPFPLYDAQEELVGQLLK